MKNKKRSIIIACVCLLVLSALLVLLLIEPETDDGQGTHEHEVSSSDYNVSETTGELLIQYEDSEIACVELTNATGAYTMRLSDDGVYSIDQYGSLPINQSYVDMAWYYATALGYSSVITMQDGSTPALEQYGLAAPNALVTVRLKDGSAVSYRVGREVPDSEGLYYYTLDGYAGVFTTEITPSLFYGDSYWLSDTFYPGSTEAELHSVSHITASGSELAAPVTITAVSSEDASWAYYSYDFVQTAPYEWACDNYQMALLEYELAYMTADEAMCAFPDAGELAAYGLDSPRLTVSFVRDGEAHSLICSDVAGDYFYALFDGRDCIYRLDTASYPILASFSERSVISSDVHVRSFEALDSITVSTASESYTFTVRREQSAGGLDAYYAYYGEKSLALADYKDFLEAFNSAICVDRAYLPEESAPYVTVTLSYFDSFGRADEIITYTAAAQRRYACSIGGRASGSVSSMWLDSLLAAARTLAQS